MSHTTNHPEYNYTVVRQFTVMTIVWGIVGMSVGVLIAAQLIWPALNFDTPWLTYSRLRPLHTNAVIFAFGCSALMATSFYVVQRTCQVRLFGGPLASFVFWRSFCLQPSRCRWGTPPPKSTPSWSGPSTSPSPWSG